MRLLGTSTAVLCLTLIVLLSAFVEAGRVKDDLAKQIKEKGPDDKISVIIQFDKRPDITEIMGIRAQAQVPTIKYQYQIIDGIALELPVKAVENIARRRNVRLVEPDYEMEAFLDVSVPVIQAPKLWEKGVIGAGVKAAVLDTGIFDRPELRVVARQDFTGEGLGDFHGHGTHVASTVGNTDLQFKGVAPDVQLMDGKVLNATGRGFTSNIIAAIDWAITNGADIVSMSIGGLVVPCDGTDSLSLAVDNAVDRGRIVVVAAGNSGPNFGTINSPGCSKKAITVGASTDLDHMTNFSSRGPTADGRVKPDIVAPGHRIVALANAATGTRSMSGTSMATPHVSGIAALLKSKNAALDQGTLLQALKSTAKNLALDPNIQGAGRVDARASFNFLNPCGDGVCSGTETCVTCAADCGGCPVEVCGNGVCGAGETSASCPVDCPPPEVCGNGVCGGGETSTNCPADCPEICGNGICAGGETCSSCPIDCGACPEVCGNGVCAGGETCSSCPGDCGACPPVCGNRRCETGETCKTCRFDCGKCPRLRGGGKVVADLQVESGPDPADVALITLGVLAIGILVLAAMGAERKV